MNGNNVIFTFSLPIMRHHNTNMHFDEHSTTFAQNLLQYSLFMTD